MDNVRQVMITLFGGVWNLFSSFEVPGFGISLAKVAIGFFVIRFSLSLLSLVTGFHSNIGAATDSIRTSSETVSQYKAVYTQQLNRAKLGGGIGFRYKE